MASLILLAIYLLYRLLGPFLDRLAEQAIKKDLDLAHAEGRNPEP
jgi:hypothetical protein